MSIQSSDLLSLAVFAGMSAIGVTLVPKLTKKATQKATKKTLSNRTSKIALDNMGPEIVRKDKNDGDDS